MAPAFSLRDGFLHRFKTSDAWKLVAMLSNTNRYVRMANLVRLGIVISCCWLGLDRAEAEPTREPRKIAVQNAILKTIESTVVPAETTGVLVSVAVTEGSFVDAGMELAKVRDDIVRLQVDRSKLQLETSQLKQQSDIDLQLASKSAAVSENELKRAENANRVVSNTYPQNEIDRLKLVLDRARLEIERAKHQKALLDIEVRVAENEHRQALDLVARHRILAPTNGMIVLVEKKTGEWVEPGTKIVQIVRVDRLRIEGFVDAADAVNELIGAPVETVVVAGASEIESVGKVVFVSPDANPVNGLVRVYIEIENRQRKLRPGLKVNARILVGKS